MIEPSEQPPNQSKRIPTHIDTYFNLFRGRYPELQYDKTENVIIIHSCNKSLGVDVYKDFINILVNELKPIEVLCYHYSLFLRLK